MNIKKTDYEKLKRDIETNNYNIRKKDEEINLLGKELSKINVLYEITRETLGAEIRDLKLILAGAVCKDNPFVDKRDTEMQVVPMYPNKKFLTL